MDGNIFDIQRFCTDDGPGIRTTVFFKGCPLKCIWCHNPESQKSAPAIAYYAHKCISCGACASVCPNGLHILKDGTHTFKREGCTLCGKCVTACLTSSLELIGRRESAEQILAEVMRDAAFYRNSGGGLTVSGGEPLMQSEFLAELLKKAKERGIHTCIETCGYASPSVIREVAKYTDIFLFDIKETDDDRHKALTGVPFAPIYENLLLLDSLGAKIILRCPLVPDINTRDEHISAIAKIAASLEGVLEVNVMAYHLLGNAKYDALNMENKMAGSAAMTEDEKAACIKAISDKIAAISGKRIKVC